MGGFGYITGKTVAKALLTKNTGAFAAARKAAFLKAHGVPVIAAKASAALVKGIVAVGSVVGAIIASQFTN
ncbi:MAG: hypothetical protein K6T83_21470 [Alicyclobacillus sp.]|nr:hypothetical protein [Alicyclobacillus sp.]